jgi:pimeloyl-ACP methyl ester carboxylesterase
MDRIRRGGWTSLLALAAGVCTFGCHQVIVFPVPGIHQQQAVDHVRGRDWSPTTCNLLTELGLENLAKNNCPDAFTLLERRIQTGRNDARILLCLAELADRSSRKLELTTRGDSLSWARDAAVYATFCLTAVGNEHPDAAISCAAEDLHNRAVTRCLWLARCRQTPSDSNWPKALKQAGIVLSSPVASWTDLGFESLRPTSEFCLLEPGLSGRRRGLGVPVIAHRPLEDSELDRWKPYGPRNVTFAATIVIEPRGCVTNWRQEPVELVLRDPLHEEDLNLSGSQQPLARDLTTPLIRRLAQSPIRNYQYLGVLDPEFYVARAGVYALDPYQPGKIPVVLIQGVWSSPRVWGPMLASLRSDPALRAAFQFWVVLYPSGFPLPVAARSLRQSLRDIRQSFDPQGKDGALDQMVIVGKSTGGQATRMLVERSGDALWNVVFTVPIDQIQASVALRAELINTFFFEPEPYVRRVIFLTTSHRGSKLGAQPGVRLGVGLIRRNNPLLPVWTELKAANGSTVFQPWFRQHALSSADGLESENPMLMALDAQPIANDVAYHSIIANIHHQRTPEKMSDGFIHYRSAHLDGAASERVVTAGHVCEANPEVIDEVRRILYVHLAGPNLVPRATRTNPSVLQNQRH